MVRAFGMVFTFFAKGRAFFKDRTLQDFKGDIALCCFNINFECETFLSWITGTKIKWHKTKNICSEKIMGLISLFILLVQFLAILNMVHLFSVQWIFPNTFLSTFPVFRRMRKTPYVLGDSTVLNIFFFPMCELLYLRKVGWHFQTVNC